MKMHDQSATWNQCVFNLIKKTKDIRRIYNLSADRQIAKDAQHLISIYARNSNVLSLICIL